MSKIFDSVKQAELASRSRQRLAATQEESAQAVFASRATDSVDRFNDPEVRANDGSSPHGTTHNLIWFVLGVLLLSSAIIFLRHDVRGMGDNRQAREVAAAGKVGEIPSPGSIVKPSPATTFVLPPTVSSDLPGFVLQVAAMKHEDNAHALAETLQQRNLPAFVFKRGASPFYRVVVGIYGDANSAVRVKDELERQGFKTILIRWLPQ